jgi:hypothetical protein
MNKAAMNGADRALMPIFGSRAAKLRAVANAIDAPPVRTTRPSAIGSAFVASSRS